MPITEREAAVRALVEITQNGAYNNIALSRALRGLPCASRAFVTELVNGVLRRLLYLDYAAGLFAAAPPRRPFIQNALRAGIYQLLYMNAPAHAVVNETVKLVKQAGFAGLSGFVNGLLRAVARAKEIPLPSREHLAEHLSVRYACPLWLVNLWLREFPQKAEALCAASLERPRLTLRVNTLKTDAAALARILEAAGAQAAPCPEEPNALFLSKSADITSLTAYQEGLFHVMDQGAMAAALALSPTPGSAVADVCAAPGGKSFLLAQLMENRGRLLAGDVHPHKIALLTQGAARLGITLLEAELRDAALIDPALDDTADFLLLDAPCSGLGLLRRKPDLKLTKKPADIPLLAKRQRALLAACARRVRPGGVLVYAVCTLTRAETTENAVWFTENFPFSGEKFPPAVEQGRSSVLQSILAEHENSPGRALLTPDTYAGDGFFIARFRKDLPK